MTGAQLLDALKRPCYVHVWQDDLGTWITAVKADVRNEIKRIISEQGDFEVLAAVDPAGNVFIGDDDPMGTES